MAQAQALAGSPEQFNEAAYRASPLFGQSRDLTLQALLPDNQAPELFCSPAAAGLEAIGETAEGRLGYVFAENGKTWVTAADFTYRKTVDNAGNPQLVLDAEGHAIPTWWVVDNSNQPTPGFDGQSTALKVYRPNTGNGFFVASGNDPGITPIHSETLTVNGPQLTIARDNGVTEVLRALAANAFCGN
jgi:hypothetical protein